MGISRIKKKYCIKIGLVPDILELTPRITVQKGLNKVKNTIPVLTAPVNNPKSSSGILPVYRTSIADNFARSAFQATFP
jgi:hypothetical protein